jgi:hypothetical protein
VGIGQSAVALVESVLDRIQFDGMKLILIVRQVCYPKCKYLCAVLDFCRYIP